MVNDISILVSKFGAEKIIKEGKKSDWAIDISGFQIYPFKTPIKTRTICTLKQRFVYMEFRLNKNVCVSTSGLIKL